MAGKYKTKPVKGIGGRPTTYCEKIADRICELVATTTDGLNKICAKYDDIPSQDTIYKWRYRNREFAEKYAEAKRQQAELLAEEISQIADDATNDYYVDSEGNDKFDSEHVQRSRLRVDTRKWIACKLLPKVYGDKTQHEVAGKDGEAIQVETKIKLAKRELDARYANMALNKITEDSEDGN